MFADETGRTGVERELGASGMAARKHLETYHEITILSIPS